MPGFHQHLPQRQTAWRPVDYAIACCLPVLVLATFARATSGEFLLYDDNAYVTANPMMRAGLSWEGFQWAFTSTHAANWHPLSWLSHMVDSQLFGCESDDAAGHHATSVVLHALSAVLLFILLRTSTGARWRSLLAASLFGLHPLRVESVAWVAQRKDVLSVALGLATLIAYTAFARRPAWPRYLLMLVLLALALAAKPTMVTLPLLLLLWDLWPLGRMRAQPSLQSTTKSSLARLFVEKAPAAALAFAVATVTYYAQSEATAVSDFAAIALRTRVESALAAIPAYLSLTFWPHSLSFLYPHPLEAQSIAASATGLLLIVIATGVAWGARRRFPYLLVGWLWFLVALLPMLGLVQVGLQWIADRYTYWPHVGLATMMAWLAADAARWLRMPRELAVTVACGVIAMLAAASYIQCAVWRDTLTLTRHAIDVQPDNSMAHSLRGQALAASGNPRSAISSYRQALAVEGQIAVSHEAETRSLLALALLASGDVDEAEAEASAAVKSKPQLAVAHQALAAVRLEQAQWSEARDGFLAALALDPQLAAAHSDLARALNELGDWNSAASHADRARRLAPRLAAAHYELGRALAGLGRGLPAVSALENALALQPEFWLAANQLAWVLATDARADVRDAARAIDLARRAAAAAGHVRPDFFATLAAAYAEAGRWTEAVESIESAIRQAQMQGLATEGFREHLESYRRQVPWRSLPASNTAVPDS